MSLVVVGSVGFDSVETPFGKRDRMLGGSASHFSISASFFADVREHWQRSSPKSKSATPNLPTSGRVCQKAFLRNQNQLSLRQQVTWLIAEFRCRLVDEHSLC